MRQYEVKRGGAKALAGDGLRRLVAEVFGTSAEEDGKVVASFGALRRLTTWTDGKGLFVETETDPSSDPSTTSETIRKYNAFLERATGFTAKERTKRAKAQAEAAG